MADAGTSEGRPSPECGHRAVAPLVSRQERKHHYGTKLQSGAMCSCSGAESVGWTPSTWSGSASPSCIALADFS